MFLIFEHKVGMVVLKAELAISPNCDQYPINGVHILFSKLSSCRRLTPVTEMRLYKSEPLEGKCAMVTDLEFEIDI